MTELKGIKIEDLNVTKSTFIKLIGLLNINLELPDDELIEFYLEPPKTLDDRFYHLSFWLDSGYYIFTLSFHFFSVNDSGINFLISIPGYSKFYDLSIDYLYESGILKTVNEVSTEIAEAEPEQPVEDAEEQENPELTPNVIEMPLCVFQLMQSRVNDYIYDNDIMEKYGDKEIPCGVMVKIMDYSPQSCFKCEIYDDTGEEPEKRILKVEPLTPLELAVFEALEVCSNFEYEYVCKSFAVKEKEQEIKFLELASGESLKEYVLEYLISKAGLEETYQAWLAERKKQEALTIL